MTFKDNIITFDAEYNREGTITAEFAECCGCHEMAICIVADCSEGEYNEATICPGCIQKLFEGADL